MPAPLPPNEAARLDALHRLQVLDTPPEPAFDDLTRLAAGICGTPLALVSLVDAHRQWFKSRHGLAAAETPRDVAFCSHTILQPDLFEVADAAADGRFAANPLVTADPHVRFYAGVPLVTADGHALGTLCVLDLTPRSLSADQRDGLRVLGRQVVAQLLLRTQVSRRQAEAREYETFRVLFEHSSDAHLIFDERDGILDCNHAAVAMLRLRSKEQVLAMHPAALSPEFQPCGRRSMDKCVDMDAAARRNGFHRFDWTHRRADGEEFPCEVTLTPVTLHGRSVLLVVWHDLTERVRAEAERRASEERFRAFMDNGPAVAYVVDEDGRAVYINEPMRRQFGITDADWLGKTEYERFPADVAEVMRAANRAVLDGGKPVVVTECTPAADGTTHVWQSYKFPLADAAGRRYLAGLSLNVTAEKRAEEALRYQAALRESLTESGPDGILVVDADLRILSVNRRFFRVWGIPEEVGEAGCDARMLAVAVARTADPEGFRARVEEIYADPNLVAAEEVLLTDGRVLERHTGPVRGADGRHYGRVWYFRDVTARKRAEQAVRASAERRRQQQIALLELIREDARDGGEAATRRVLGVVAGILQVERVSVWHLTAERDRLVCGLLYEWGADRYSSGAALSAADYPAYFAALAADEVIAAADAHTDPRTREFRDGYLVPLNVGAMLDIPLRLNGRVGGVLCAEHVGGRREWAADEQVFALAAAGVLALTAEQAERRRAEEALRAGEERFRGAFDFAPIGMALVGLDGRWLRVNRALCDILGYTADELLATDYQTLTHPDDLDSDLDVVRQFLAGQIGSYQLEKRYFHKSGAVVHAVLAVSLARDVDGRPQYFITHIKNVTARKRAEDALRESEERFRAAMEGSLDAMFFLAAERDAGGVITDFRFTDLNSRAARLVAREREGVIGRRLCELLPVNRTAGFFDRYVRVVETGETLEEEFPIAADGITAGWLHHQVVKVGDGVAITSQDVTARKRAELELRASENQLRTLGDNLPDGVVFQYVVGADGRHRFPYMSRGIERLAGVTAEAVMADADVLFGQTHPDDAAPLAAAIRRSMEELSEFDMEIRRINPDGEVCWFHARTAPRRLPDGGTAWDGVMIDVTTRKRAENELRASEERFRTTIDRLAEGVYVADIGTDRLVDVNAAALDMLGYTRDEFLALAPFDLMSGETPGSFERSAEQVRQRLAADGRCDVGRRAFRRKDGTAVPVDLKVTVVPNGRAGLHAVIVRDVTEQVAYEEQLLAYQEELERANVRLRALATTDGLTGLKNRAAFDAKLAEEYERAVRHDRPLSVMMLDVDHFKEFNDSFGHPAGDGVLRQVAGTLADGVRATDAVARYGGEEFVVLLPDTDHAGAMVLAERLRRAVAGGEWGHRPVTISVGVSTLTPATADAAALVQEADQALYRSKQTGRNCVTHGSSPIPQAATARPLPVG